jgi:predicted ATPase
MHTDADGRPAIRRGSQPCDCVHPPHAAKLIAVTGGPGAGKSAVLELAARSFCSHVLILPEAASILFGGGFPRLSGFAARCAAQRAIFHVQRELERLAIEDGSFGMILCDRGTLDGAAYWPGDPEEFWQDLEISKGLEMARYHSVLHLQTPTDKRVYNHQNVVRVETPDEAHIIDLRILSVWAGHSDRAVIPPMENFLQKALRALKLLRAQLPRCCQGHRLQVSS